MEQPPTNLLPVEKWEVQAIMNLSIPPAVATRVVGWLVAFRCGSGAVLGLSDATVKKYLRVLHEAGVNISRGM